MGTAFCPEQCYSALGLGPSCRPVGRGYLRKCIIRVCCKPVLQSSTDQWALHFSLNNVAVHWWRVTAHVYEEQISMSVLAVIQPCCKPGHHTADGADFKWSAASNVIAGAAGFQASMLQHTQHKLHVMTVSFSSPAAQLAAGKRVVACTLVFCSAPCSFVAFAVLPIVYCGA